MSTRPQAVPPHELAEWGRSAYTPSGDVDWPRFIPLCVTALILSTAVAAALWLCGRFGVYFVVIMPVLGGFVCYYLARRIVEKGRCRNVFLAGLVGAVLGAVGYLGHFQAELIQFNGWSVAHRVDLLPRYLWFRIQHMQFFEAGKARMPQAPNNRFDIAMNAFILAAEGALGIGVALAGGVVAARRVYCEPDGPWAREVKVPVTTEDGPRIVESLRDGTLLKVLRTVTLQPIPDPQRPPPHTVLIFQFAFGPAASIGTLTILQAIRSTWHRPLASHVILTDHEIDAIPQCVTTWRKP